MFSDTNCADIVMGATQVPIVDVTDERGETDKRIYVSKTVGEVVNNLAAFSILKNEIALKGINSGLDGETICKKLVYLLDDDIHEDYAAALVPRAVGYTAAFMDHFFKSQIEISLPDSGVYASVLNNGSLYLTLT